MGCALSRSCFPWCDSLGTWSVGDWEARFLDEPVLELTKFATSRRVKLLVDGVQSDTDHKKIIMWELSVLSENTRVKEVISFKELTKSAS